MASLATGTAVGGWFLYNTVTVNCTLQRRQIQTQDPTAVGILPTVLRYYGTCTTVLASKYYGPTVNFVCIMGIYNEPRVL